MYQSSTQELDNQLVHEIAQRCEYLLPKDQSQRQAVEQLVLQVRERDLQPLPALKSFYNNELKPLPALQPLAELNELPPLTSGNIQQQSTVDDNQANRVTVYAYDWHYRTMTTKSGIDRRVICTQYSNLGQATTLEQYKGVPRSPPAVNAYIRRDFLSNSKFSNSNFFHSRVVIQ